MRAAKSRRKSARAAAASALTIAAVTCAWILATGNRDDLNAGRVSGVIAATDSNSLFRPQLQYAEYLGGTSANALAVSPRGNVYVGGTLSGAFGPAVRSFLLDLKLGGRTIRFRTVIRREIVNDLVLGDNGRAYLVGETFVGRYGFPSLVVVGGRGKVVKRVKLPISGGTARSVAVAGNGDLYIAGYSLRGAFLAAMETGGTIRLLKNLGPGLATSVAVGRHGAVYVTGDTVNEQLEEEPSDVFVVKLKGNGSRTAYRRVLGDGEDAGAANVVVDRSGRAYVGFTVRAQSSAVTGESNTVTSEAVHIARLDRRGAVERDYRLFSSPGSNSVSQIALGADGFVYVTGTASQGLPGARSLRGPSSDDVYITVIDFARGTVGWKAMLGGAGQDDSDAIAAARGRRVYVAGSTLGFLPGGDPLGGVTLRPPNAFLVAIAPSSHPN